MNEICGWYAAGEFLSSSFAIHTLTRCAVDLPQWALFFELMRESSKVPFNAFFLWLLPSLTYKLLHVIKRKILGKKSMR